MGPWLVAGGAGLGGVALAEVYCYGAGFGVSKDTWPVELAL